MTVPFKAACVQLRSSDDVAENIRDPIALIREAAGQGAHFIATPENTTLMAPDGGAKLAASYDEAHDPALPVFAGLAKELKRLAADRVAGDQGQRHQDRQPLLPVRAGRHDRGALHQDPSVRCRLCHRARVIASPTRWRAAAKRVVADTALGQDRPDASATTCASRSFIARWRRRAPSFHRAVCLHRADRQGALACAAAGPRHRERRLRHRAGARRAACQWPQDLWPQPDRRRPGAKCWRKPAPSRASSPPRSIRRCRHRRAPKFPACSMTGIRRSRNGSAFDSGSCVRSRNPHHLWHLRRSLGAGCWSVRGDRLFVCDAIKGTNSKAGFATARRSMTSRPSGHLSCPSCNSVRVEKAIMAPAVAGTKKTCATKAAKPARCASSRRACANMCRRMPTMSGPRFAEEARKIHYGETPDRHIYGEATAKRRPGRWWRRASMSRPLPPDLEGAN